MGANQWTMGEFDPNSLPTPFNPNAPFYPDDGKCQGCEGCYDCDGEGYDERVDAAGMREEEEYSNLVQLNETLDRQGFPRTES